MILPIENVDLEYSCSVKTMIWEFIQNFNVGTN
jgi:hypothetical protein